VCEDLLDLLRVNFFSGLLAGEFHFPALSVSPLYFINTSPHGPSPQPQPHSHSRCGHGRRCAGARRAARLRLAQRAAAVLLLHRAVRLEQRAEVDCGAVRAVSVRAVLAISHLELKPEQPDFGHGGEAVFERVEGGRLRQQHEDAPQRLEQ
jgi:hypothetical protein